MMGQILFPFMGTGLTLIMAYNNMFPDTPLDFVKYLAFMIPAGIVMVTVYVLVMKLIFRVDVSKVADFKQQGEAQKITKDQKKGVLCIYCIHAIKCLLRIAFRRCGSILVDV